MSRALLVIVSCNSVVHPNLLACIDRLTLSIISISRNFCSSLMCFLFRSIVFISFEYFLYLLAAKVFPAEHIEYHYGNKY